MGSRQQDRITMSHDYAQRRRVAVALAITTIAVPAAFLLNRGNEPAQPPAGTVIGSIAAHGSTADQARPANAPSVTDAMGTTPVGFLDGTVPARDADPATIAIPRLPDSINGTASFRRELTNVAGCMAKGVPFNSRVTVTNRDNSRSVQCINNVGGVQPNADVVLHADAFVQIGDLTDAPIAVQITW
jgi:hypothetical protein